MLHRLKIFVLVTLLVPTISYAQINFWGEGSSSAGPFCGKFNEAKSVSLRGKPLVMITHPQFGQFDVNSSSFRGISMSYQWLQKFDIETVVLVENSNSDNYFTPTCKPTAFVHSDGGEFDFDITASTVISMGGFFSACLRQSVEGILSRWKPNGHSNTIRLILPMEAIYDKPFPLDGSSVKDTAYSDKLDTFRSITGTDTMNLLQQSRLMGQEAFIDRVLTYFSKEGAVIPGLAGPQNSRWKILLPPNYTADLNIYSYSPAMNFHRNLQNGSASLPKLEIDLVDYTSLIALTQTTLPVKN